MHDLPAHVGRQTDEETGYALVCNATPDGDPHTDALCGKPATHHLRWNGQTTENSFACGGHLGFALNYRPLDVHSVEDSACGMPGAHWVTGSPSYCAMDVLDDEPALVGVAGDAMTPVDRAPATRDTHLSDDAWALIDEATPPTTRRAYREEWTRFTRWCDAEQRTPLPATAQTLAQYAAHLAGRDLAPSSIGKAMAAITKAHQTAGHGEPDRRGAREVLRGYRRRYARTGGTTKRAPALTLDALRAMVATLDPTTIVGVRDRAIIVLGFAMGARRSEIAALNLADLEPHPEGIQVTVRLSKTDKDGAGRIVAVPYGSNIATCPVRSVAQWREALAHHGRDTGPLFLRIDRHGRLGHVATGKGDPDGRITGETVAAIVRRAAEAAGLDAAQAYSGHSLRRGFATAAYSAPDADLVRIARHGGWKEGSAALFGYLEEVDRWRKNPAAGIGL